MRTSREIDFRFRLKLKITLVESTYPGQRPECPSLSPHFLLVWVIDQVCSVKMAGYWPSSFFACLWTETKSRSISSQKKNLVNKGFIIWLLVKFCFRDTAGSPERARCLHLARSGSQSQRAIWFILPARGASHIIREFISHDSLSNLLQSQWK